MEIKQAQEKTHELITHYGDYWPPLAMFARLVEEVGELGRAINIKYGEKKSKFNGDGREIEKELADVLLTILAIANSQKIDLTKELQDKMEYDFEKMKGVYKK